MRYAEDKYGENTDIGFVDWLWPVPNDIKALYFVLTSVLIIILLSWRAWHEVSYAETGYGVGGVAVEVIAFSPAAGFISMFVMSVFMAGGLAMFGKGIFRRGVEFGEERGIEQGIEQGLTNAASWYQRKTDAEARGEPFDEPPPWERSRRNPTRNGKNANP